MGKRKGREDEGDDKQEKERKENEEKKTMNGSKKISR